VLQNLDPMRLNVENFNLGSLKLIIRIKKKEMIFSIRIDKITLLVCYLATQSHCLKKFPKHSLQFISKCLD